jgi:hypothetical protein
MEELALFNYSMVANSADSPCMRIGQLGLYVTIPQILPRLGAHYMQRPMRLDAA